MSNKTGFYITKLAVVGPNKPDAVLTFADGLNVISGASDTGKSFALSCIDFAFGTSKLPRQIPEISGYQTVMLRITVRETKEEFLFERGLAGGDVRIKQFAPSGNQIHEAVIPFKHDADNTETLSGILLKISGLAGKQIRKNAKGQRQNLSFRNVAFLSVVDEERIISERPPQLSGQFILQTCESEVFRLLITGHESGEVIVAPTKAEIAGVDAKLEMIQRLIADGEAELKAANLNEDELDKELKQIEKFRTEILSQYETSRVSVTDLEKSLKEHASTLREAQARNQVIEGLLKRFQLLDLHYQSNIDRLTAIQETGSLLQSFPSKRCLVCGAAPEAHRLEQAGEKYQLSTVQDAAQAESKKVKVLKSELQKVLKELETESLELTDKVHKATRAADKIQSQIDNELMPRVKDSLETLNLQAKRRDELLRSKVVIDNLSKLRIHEGALDAVRNKKTPAPKLSPSATPSELNAFAQVVEGVLKAWKYPNLGRVNFSESEQDLVINGTSRASHGKGVRALICAAFIIGLQKHCQSKNLPHPTLVALDSPLVAYREPDAAGSEELKQAGVKEAFYSALADGVAEGQVIIFENEDPPARLRAKFTHHHFTKNSNGRYGFFPNLVGTAGEQKALK